MASSKAGEEDPQEEDPALVRARPDVVAPPRFPLEVADVWPEGKNINLQALGKHLHKEGRLTKELALKIVSATGELLKPEPNIIRLDDPITVCGDVHGQFFDLLRLLEAGGDPKDTKYLFLGDYVDRGCFSTEVVFYLFAHKLIYPKTFYMLRGNHECRHLTAFFNFKEECQYKYDLEVYDTIMSVFDCLPIAAVINSKFLCIHGGLSPDISSVEDIENIDRYQEVPREGPFCDLLWADPVPEGKEDDPSEADTETTWFAYNETRQCSYIFGVDATSTFLKKNKLTAIIRAHEAQADGYKMHMINDQSGIPRVITIFSAPNYCDVYKNKGAILKFDNELLNIRQFVCSPHPYYLPNFMDVFAWSLPFVAEKVTDMLSNIIKYDAEQPMISGSSASEMDVSKKGVSVPNEEALLNKRGGVLKQKVVAVTKMMRIYKTLRQERENLMKLKQLTPNKQIPFGLIRKGPDSITKAIKSFDGAMSADRPNEAMPSENGAAPTKQEMAARRRNSTARIKDLGNYAQGPES